MSKTVVNRFKDAASVAENTASALIKKIHDLLEIKPEIHLMLTGGTVGIASLAALNANSDRSGIDFGRVNLWWGDERYVES